MKSSVRNNSYSLLALVIFVVSVAIRLIDSLTGNINIFRACAFYLLVLGGVVVLLLDSRRHDDYAPAFCYDNSFRLDLLGYIASIGFFVDFVYNSVRVYLAVDNGSSRNLISFLPLCIGLAMALLCSLYYAIVGLSFGSTTYDFKELKLLHLAPIFWIVVRIISVLPQAVKPGEDVDMVLEYVVLAMLAGGCYFFAYEVSSQERTRVASMFMFRSSFYTGLLFFFDQLMLALSGANSIGSVDGMLSITVLCISLYMYFFEKNIIAHSA